MADLRLGSRTAAILGVLLLALGLVALLAGCGSEPLTEEATPRPGLPQLIRITIVPDTTPTPLPSPTALPTFPPPTATPIPPTPTPEPTPQRKLVTRANVTAFELEYSNDFPVVVTLRYWGSHPDGCTRVERVAQSRTPRGIMVGVWAVRPYYIVCSQVLTPFQHEVILDTTGLGLGEYEIDVNGRTQTMELKVGMVEVDDPELLCLAPGEGQLGYRSEIEGYCFVYPEAYSLIDVEPGLVLVTAQQRSDVPAPLVAEVRIENLGPAEESSPQEIAERELAEWLNILDPGDWVELPIGGEAGVLVEQVPGNLITRQAYFTHNGVSYRMIAAPFGGSRPQEQLDEAQALLETVLGSLAFFK